MDYLDEKSIFKTLEDVGLSKIRLIYIFAFALLVLLILFAFIFAGISAFAITGGSFGSIINSAFPCLAGGL